MLLSIATVLAMAMLAPQINRLAGRWTGYVLALAPLAVFIYFAMQIGTVASGEQLHERQTWIAALGVQMSFYLDGLSLLFAILIMGIGTLIVLYAGPYLEGHRDRGRFYAWLLLFMAAMLGLVLADNLITLFVFWELTSISSYFLIGFDHHRETARKCALQALLVTASGGLALLAGFVLLGIAGGSMEMSELLNQREAIQEHSLFAPIMILLLAGAFTKSAQFPFHFWLPNAMEAPTPVSAYLHSSTMVKAGVYLMARVSPVMSGNEMWMIALTAFGGATMLIGAWLAVQQVYLKRILAYSTISALGVLTFLLGLGAVDDPELSSYAFKAFAVFILAHALYKATLFLVAGSITHETGEKDVTKLGGLARAMPISAVAGVLAALSMAGFPPFFGFIGKELLIEAALHQGALVVLLTSVTVFTGVLFVVVSCLVALRPFFGKRPERDRPSDINGVDRRGSQESEHEGKRRDEVGPSMAGRAHDPPFAMWFGPALLALGGLLLGLLPGVLGQPLLEPVLWSVSGRADTLELVLWHGVNVALGLGVLAIVLGLITFSLHGRLVRAVRPLRALDRIGPERTYDWGLAGIIGFAKAQTRLLQSGYLRMYLLLIVSTTVLLIALAMLRVPQLPSIALLEWTASDLYENLYKLIAAGLIAGGTYGAVHSKSRLTAIANTGVVGYGVALLYSLYGAPDLAITQFIVETLTVILFVLVFYHLPEYPKISGKISRARDLAVAISVGAIMAVLVLIATSVQTNPPISDRHVEWSVPEGHGRNIVNVILVDFRAMDTLGEITVLAVSGIGVFALLKLRRPLKRKRERAL